VAILISKVISLISLTCEELFFIIDIGYGYQFRKYYYGRGSDKAII
jgi:hypothetical protein